MRYTLLVLGSIFLPLTAFATAVPVDNLFVTDCATSSDNIYFTANSFDYEAYLYETNGDDISIASGACGVTVNTPNHCSVTYAPLTGENIKSLYNWSNKANGPTLENGEYAVVEDSNSSPCGNGVSYTSCIAAADPGQYQVFTIVSDIADCTPPTPSATSTTTTIDRAVNMADFLVDILGFAIMLGVLFLK